MIRLAPGTSSLPRVSLGRYPTPCEPLRIGTDLWIKRDDLGGDPIGGNKLRSLETLLGAVRPGDLVATMGPQGSNHALATALYARRLGARPVIVAWWHALSPSAADVWNATRAFAQCWSMPMIAVPAAVAAARLSGARWIPAGGSSPLGALGHVSAGLELAAQIEAGVLPSVTAVVVPLGSGGTTAGLALGLALAGTSTEVVAVRVAPRIVANVRRVRALAHGAHRIIAKFGGPPMPPLRIRIVHDFYGGAYGRRTPEGDRAADRMRAEHGLSLDPTYSAKAFAAALALRTGGPVLFWNTFDARSERMATTP